MGVSGCGKTTIGEMLSQKLFIPFLDADNYHPPSNIKKMNSGIPLNDNDRFSWLEKLSQLLKDHLEGGVILACSALKESYRIILQEKIEEKIVWVHLEGVYEIILERMQKRVNHFMSPSLLMSQFNSLEIPGYAINISVDQNPNKIVEEIIERISL